MMCLPSSSSFVLGRVLCTPVPAVLCTRVHAWIPVHVHVLCVCMGMQGCVLQACMLCVHM